MASSGLALSPEPKLDGEPRRFRALHRPPFEREVPERETPVRGAASISWPWPRRRGILRRAEPRREAKFKDVRESVSLFRE